MTSRATHHLLFALASSVACTNRDASASTNEHREPPTAEASPSSPSPAAAAPAPPEVPPLADTDIAAWRAYASDPWWRAGEEVPCKGEVVTRTIMSGVTEMTGEGLACIGKDGDSVTWFRHGDAACPAGAKLVGEPPPVLDMIACMRGNIGHGRYTLWRPDGSLELTGEVRDGLHVGMQVALFPDGGLKTVAHYEDDQLHGLTIHFYPDGQRAAQMSFVAGKREGVAIAWRENGRIAEQTPYRNGLIDGTAIAWADDGRVCGTSELRAGTGTWTSYWDNCAVRRRGESKDGQEIGVWPEFDRDGRPIRSP